MRILLIGSYPPPHGGLSTHVYNLQHFLQGSDDEVRVIDIGRQRRLVRNGCIPIFNGWDLFRKVRVEALWADIIHIHTGLDNTISRILTSVCFFFIVIAGCSQCTALTIHAGKAVDYFQSLRGIRRYYFRYLLRRFYSVIVVNPLIGRATSDLTRIPEEKFSIIPAFAMDDGFKKASIPTDLAIQIQKSHPVISCAIFLEEDYGVEDVLELSRRLMHDYPYHIFIVMGEGKNKELFKKRRNVLGLKNRIYFTGNLSRNTCLRVMSMSQLFLRPSHYDGDSNSVREAITLNVPVVATNTGFRPNGVHVYPVGNVTAMEYIVRDVLKKSDQMYQVHHADGNLIMNENLHQVRDIYLKIIRNVFHEKL